MLKIYNTLTRKKELLQPISPPNVGMYVCGPTVYDYCHIGHARAMVVFDVISSWIRTSGYKLNYVRNITDIDDKIIKRALENKQSVSELTGYFIEAFHQDEKALGITAPDFEPRATEHIPEMIKLIQNLIDKGFAYKTTNGDICFSIRNFPTYGKLSGKSIDDLRVGERVEQDHQKNDALDFVLWKKAKPDEPKWSSPFGDGRPGWHIECSAMSQKYLGEKFDIHGGGQDLQFPHHENEIAQSESESNKKNVNIWIHNGFVNVNKEKMAKSLGNFFTIRDVLKTTPAEVLRFFLLRAHYRSPINFSNGALAEAKSAMDRLYQPLRDHIDDLHLAKNYQINWQDQFAGNFKFALDDDFNTPIAISVLFELVQQINRKYELDKLLMLYSLGKNIGILQLNPDAYFKKGTMENTLSDNKIEELIAEREIYRNNKNFSEADRIRDELLEAGVILDDSPNGTTWKRI